MASAESAGGLPAGRRLEGLAGVAVLANLVVLGAFLRAFQDLVSLDYLFETVFCAGLFVYIRMVLTRQAAVGGLDRLVIGRGLHAEGRVIVLELHGRHLLLGWSFRSVVEDCFSGPACHALRR